MFKKIFGRKKVEEEIIQDEVIVEPATCETEVEEPEVIKEKGLLEYALEKMSDDKKEFIDINRTRGSVPSVTFHIQSHSVSDVGVNGVQVHDLIQFSRNFLQLLNEEFESSFNKEALNNLTAAIIQLEKRTQDRIARGVEGLNKE